MCKFIEIKNSFGETIAINTDCIISINPLADGTRINFLHRATIDNRDYLELPLPYNQVLELLVDHKEVPTICYS